MSLRLGALYDALLTAQGVSPDDAKKAAEEVAAYNNDIAELRGDVTLLKWMVGALIVLTSGVIWQGFAIMGRLP
jgi:hypothetical protein